MLTKSRLAGLPVGCSRHANPDAPLESAPTSLRDMTNHEPGERAGQRRRWQVISFTPYHRGLGMVRPTGSVVQPPKSLGCTAGNAHIYREDIIAAGCHDQSTSRERSRTQHATFISPKSLPQFGSSKVKLVAADPLADQYSPIISRPTYAQDL